MTVFMLALMMFTKNTQNLFGEIASISVLLTILPYYYSALNLLHYIETRKKAFFQMAGCILGMFFCFSAFAGANTVTLAITIIVSLMVFIFYESKDRTAFKKKYNS